ncbi:MAG: TIR domain-containing protein [Parvularculaceae bacterium]|nr:TIR domain-containing protein [Parvularculaceae bacterium]
MGDYKFRAFISYSHADEQWGAWLQRSLERFRAPKAFAARLQQAGKPLRLAPVFRDREDLPVAGNLNDAIQSALADSEYQIVLCSPNAAKSRWVNEEIKLFHRLHGPGRCFAIIVAGEPGSADAECFPPALRFKLDASGAPTAESGEPLAADAREQGDGKRVALLKTAAGMLGVGLDDLVRRDARARARRLQAIAAGTSAIAASMTFAALFAINQRNEARTARGEAENLIEFMLSDLSDRLEPVGSLSILEEVGGEVLDYYDNQELKSLDAEALSRRARGLMKLGQVDQRRGDLDAALKAYEAAFASTEEQLRRKPDDANRIFDHAQSIFYLGEAARILGDHEGMVAKNSEYLRYAERLVAIDAKNPKWRLELAYATSNIGAVNFETGNIAESVDFFERSVAARKSLFDDAPQDRKLALAYAYALSWLGYAELSVGNFARAIEVLQDQLAVYELIAPNGVKSDFQVLEALVTAQRRIAGAQAALGLIDAASVTISAAREYSAILIERDPSKVNALVNASAIARFSSFIAEAKGEGVAKFEQADRAVDLARRAAIGGGAGVKATLCLALAWRSEISGFLPSATDEELRKLTTELGEAGDSSNIDAYLGGALAQARLAEKRGDQKEMRSIASSALGHLDNYQGQLPIGATLTVAWLYFLADDAAKAAAFAGRLSALGFRHPKLSDLQTALGNAQL